MGALEKAKLFKLNAAGNPEPAQGIDVQFNPGSLKLTLSNQVEGGRSRGRQQRQFNGQSSTELAFDLHFDTSDEGSTETPRSVREKTGLIEQFVVPQLARPGGSQRIVPPRVRFEWGGLRIDGLISSLAIDFDHFAHNGVPLRAKMGVSIKEQDARYEILQASAGAAAPDRSAGAPPPAGPGSGGGGPTNRTAPALGGESLADFARRQGLPPDAWRGLAAGIEGSLSLSAGLEIDFNASLGFGASLGLSAGFAASAGSSLEAQLGLVASGGVEAGFALSAAGGVTAALNTVETVRAASVAESARSAFETPRPAQPQPALPPPTAGGVPAPAAPLAPGSAGPPPAAVSAQAISGSGAIPRAEPAQGSGKGPALPRVDAPPLDQRARSFGASIPLRPLKARAADEYALAAGGSAPLRPEGGGGAAPTTRDRGVAPWVALPAGPVAGGSGSAKSCGCSCPCCHEGGSKR